MKSIEKLHHSKRKLLAKRWVNEPLVLSNSSPFGTTAAGLQDFRAFFYPDIIGVFKTKIKGTAFKNVDFSYADLNNVIFENCSFADCLFTCSVLHNIILENCKFLRCFFPYTDLRAAGVGIDGGEFEWCEFLRPKLSRISFHLVTFKNIEFVGKDWSHVGFGVADFWNCRFIGVFRDCEFQDRGASKKLTKFAEKNKFGFHNVDLTAAEFTLVGFPEKWVFENVLFPASKTVKLVRAKSLRAVLQFYPEDSLHIILIKRYLAIFVLDASDDQICFVSKHDLLDLGDSNAANEIFDQLSSINTA
jgi:uncharacterized protein YjbI with pentapeptide repeats